MPADDRRKNRADWALQQRKEAEKVGVEGEAIAIEEELWLGFKR